MASNISDQSLDKITKEPLDCFICSKRFKEPRTLNCLHNFCLECLQELNIKQQEKCSTSELTCPMCGKTTMLNDNELDTLPNNFTLSALVEEATMQVKLQGGQGSEIICESCDENNQAVSRCMECDYFICQECNKAHGHLTVLKSHKVYTLAQLRSGEIAYKSKLRDHIPKCKTHLDQEISGYCSTCEQMICPTCTALDHTSSEHSLTSLAEALEKCKREVAEMTMKVEKHKAEFGAAISKTDNSLQELNALYAETFKKISSKADKEVARIREQEQRLQEEAEKIYKDSLFLQSMDYNPHRNQRNY